MSSHQGLLRRAHFLGTKVRTLRKRNHLTLDDLSARCVRIDAEAAPSVSYLSMIENGKRVPSERVLEIIAEIFRKDVNWFFDESLTEGAIAPVSSITAVRSLPLEPSFLFSENLLQSAIPELLSQTGTTGRQFAHLLIRAHQESKQNRFPDLERAAESAGKKQFPLDLADVLRIAKRHGLEIEWFDQAPFKDKRGVQRPLNIMVRSFFDAPGTIHVNRRLEDDLPRLKYDIANHIAHKVLHDGDGGRAPQVSGSRISDRRFDAGSPDMDAKDILYAWRDFECDYFAAALLGPKTAFRQALTRYAYAIDMGRKLELTAGLVMKRMSSVSPYPHWHYFDAYPPGNLHTVYRGNGIPLPWGNMTAISDPCAHWAVFRMLNSRSTKPSAQISILKTGDDERLYCCQSVRTRDAADNAHVLCAGVDLSPALLAQDIDARKTIEQIEASCNRNGGSGLIPAEARRQLENVGRILNIGWINDGAARDATIICPRSSACPRDKHCLGRVVSRHHSQIDEIRESVLAQPADA